MAAPDERNETLIKIDWMLKNIETAVSSSTIFGATPVSTSNVTEKYSKLLKLEITKLEGNVLQWQGFWDQISSTIDSNSQLKNIDKFNYFQTYSRKKQKQSPGDVLWKRCFEKFWKIHKKTPVRESPF